MFCVRDLVNTTTINSRCCAAQVNTHTNTPLANVTFVPPSPPALPNPMLPLPLEVLLVGLFLPCASRKGLFRACQEFISQQMPATRISWLVGATAARLTPDQKAGGSNPSQVSHFFRVLARAAHEEARGPPESLTGHFAPAKKTPTRSRRAARAARIPHCHLAAVCVACAVG